MTIEKDIRDGYFDELCAFGMEDKSVMLLANDMDVFGLQELKNHRPKQFINMGITEQNMVNVAAGLASTGKKVFIYGISSFMLYRCYEQLKFNVCSMNLPVTIIGIGSGLSFSFDGPTHHGTQDLAALRALPEMSVLNPCDWQSAQFAAQAAPNSPTFVRIDKGNFPVIYAKNDTEGFKKFSQDKDSKICMVTTGTVTHAALMARQKLFEKWNIDVDLIDISQISPFPKISFLQYTHLYTFEEHDVTGGLGTTLYENLPSKKPQIISTGLPHQQILEYGPRDYFLQKFGLDENSMVEKIRCH